MITTKNITAMLLLGALPFALHAREPRSDIYVDSKGQVHQGQTLSDKGPNNADEDRDNAKTAEKIKSVDDASDMYLITRSDSRRDSGNLTEITKVYSQVLGKDGKPIAYEVASDQGHVIVQADSLPRSHTQVASGQKLVSIMQGEDEHRLIDVTYNTLTDLLKSKDMHDQQVLREFVRVGESRSNFARTRIAKFKEANKKTFKNSSTPTPDRVVYGSGKKSPVQKAVEGATSDAARE